MKTPKSKRNITIGYSLMALNNAFFWYATWLLFIYNYLDLKQVALLQILGLLIRVIAEVPTGALADLLGKKRTLFIAFLLTAIGEIYMGFSFNFISFSLSFMITSLGYSFYSGTIDAFMYDSLVENDETLLYPKVLSKSQIVTNVSVAVATLMGAILFKYWGGLPFVITGVFKFFGLFILLLAVEPKVDTNKFSFNNFILQTVLGLKCLLGKKMIRITTLLLILGSFTTVAYELLDDIAVVEWGYSATGISILYTAVIFLSIPAGYFYDRLSKRFNTQILIGVAIILLAANYLFALWISTFIWSFFFLLRVIYSPIKNAAITDAINSNITSNIRATTLSTYELIVRIPFLVTGPLIAIYLDLHGIKNFALLFAMTLLVFYCIYSLYPKSKKLAQV